MDAMGNTYFSPPFAFSVQAVFDLTKEIFGEIFAEDPNLNQPIWMKPCRIASTYFRRVKDPNDLEEIKVGHSVLPICCMEMVFICSQSEMCL